MSTAINVSLVSSILSTTGATCAVLDSSVFSLPLRVWHWQPDAEQVSNTLAGSDSDAVPVAGRYVHFKQ